MMRYKFQHYIDISTSASSLTMIKINAGGDYAMQRMKHLWGAFKYVKMGRVSIKLLPASTLPVDPLGLSYENTDPQTVDPRDQMNPGLVRITNGENIVDDFTGWSDDQMEQVYINTMLDPRWSKFMLQSGFRRSAVPLYWNVGQLEQDAYPGATINVPGTTISGTRALVDNTSTIGLFDGVPGGNNGYFSLSTLVKRSNTDPRGLFQVGHRGRMGWMPTDAFQLFTAGTSTQNLRDSEEAMVQPLPSINVITVLLPKAYKTLYYYRLFITEEYFLSGIKNTGVNVDGTEFRAIDNFMEVSYPNPIPPYQGRGDPDYPFGRPLTKNDGDPNH